MLEKARAPQPLGGRRTAQTAAGPVVRWRQRADPVARSVRRVAVLVRWAGRGRVAGTTCRVAAAAVAVVQRSLGVPITAGESATTRAPIPSCLRSMDRPSLMHIAVHLTGDSLRRESAATACACITLSSHACMVSTETARRDSGFARMRTRSRTRDTLRGIEATRDAHHRREATRRWHRVHDVSRLHRATVSPHRAQDRRRADDAHGMHAPRGTERPRHGSGCAVRQPSPKRLRTRHPSPKRRCPCAHAPRRPTWTTRSCPPARTTTA